jgi:hypothetical protein
MNEGYGMMCRTVPRSYQMAGFITERKRSTLQDLICVIYANLSALQDVCN